jgi:phosphate transport system substrate-binding protein
LTKLTKKWLVLVIAISLVATIILAGCSSTASSTPTPATTSANPVTTTSVAPVKTTSAPVSSIPASNVTLTGAGSTFDNPLFSQWFDTYFTLTGVKVNYQAVGSGTGIQQITAGTVDFGASDGIMTDAQVAAAQAAFGPILHIPVTSGSTAIVYNLPDIPSGTLKLTGTALADIYLKKVLTWNDPEITALNPGLKLPNTPIAVVHRSDGSGTTNIFTNYLSKVSSTWATQIGAANSVNWPGDIGGSGSAGVAGSVQNTPGAIGYVELAYANQSNIPFIQIQNAAGNWESPSLAGTTAAAQGITLPADMKIMITNSSNPNAYPIVGFSWVLAYVNQTDKTKGTALAKMLWWGIHDGQQFASNLVYGPLSPSAVTNAENEILSMNYQGQALITR